MIVLKKEYKGTENRSFSLFRGAEKGERRRKIRFFAIFFVKHLVGSKKSSTFAPAFEKEVSSFTFAAIAQLVEHDLAKVGVASSSLVFRSYLLKRECPGGGMVDALVSGTSVSDDVQVRVLFWAPLANQWRDGGIGRRATLRG